MRKSFAGSPLPATAALVLVALAAGVFAAPAVLAAAEQAMPAAAMPSGLRGEVLFMLKDADKKLTSLAEATPAEKFSWRPGEGVRSMGEVLEHVAGSNYFLAGFWGGKPPAGVDPAGLEKRGGDKAQVMADLRASYDFMYQQIGAMTDRDLDRPVDFMGRKATVRMILLGTAVHSHEHLGQAIAYARTNGIVPPWSQPQPKAGK
jgi:uncharacterized damage-inducible protein DinB